MRLACLLWVIGSIGTVMAAPAQPQLVVFAAASLTDVLHEISDSYTRETGQAITLSFAASSVLARQIESGAPADVFLPADVKWMDYLEKRHLINPASRVNLLSNRLVLISAADSSAQLKIAPGFALAAALGQSRLATGDPASVPAGRYARHALISLGVWNSVADQLVPTDNVRAALTLVARGEVPLGIVYETDVLTEKQVRVVGVFPADSHPQIVYPVAVTRQAKAGATRYTAFLRSLEGRKIFTRHGFRRP